MELLVQNIISVRNTISLQRFVDFADFVGYGMLARASFGMWGSYFCIILNVFQSFVFYVSLRSPPDERDELLTELVQGTQMYFGGQAFVIILNSIFPSFLRLKNTLPERYTEFHTCSRSPMLTLR
jgi:hypothetical protein